MSEIFSGITPLLFNRLNNLVARTFIECRSSCRFTKGSIRDWLFEYLVPREFANTNTVFKNSWEWAPTNERNTNFSSS